MKIPSSKEIQSFIFNLPLIVNLIDWSKRRSLPGFFKVPIYDVIVFILNEIKRHTLISRANSMSFSFFLSLFPSIIALFTMVPYFQKYILSYFPAGTEIDEIMETMQTQIEEIMPGNAGEMISGTITDVLNNPRVGLLSFGFLLAIYFASNGMIAMMKGFEKSHKSTFKRRIPIKKRALAILLTFLLGMLVFVSVILVVLGKIIVPELMQFLHASRFSPIIMDAMRWFIIIALFYMGIAMIYRYGAATIRKFNWFSPGTTLATILSILSSLVFSFYVDNFGAYNKLYGSIGTIIVVMLWIQINAFILLIGFELNASIAVNRDLKIAKEEE